MIYYITLNYIILYYIVYTWIYIYTYTSEYPIKNHQLLTIAHLASGLNICRKSLMTHGPSSPCAWTARSPDGVKPSQMSLWFVHKNYLTSVCRYIYNVYMFIYIYIYMCILYAYVYISRFELNHPKHGYLSFEPPTSRNFSGLLTPQQLTPRSFLRLHGRSVRTGPCHEFLTVSAQLSGYQFRRVCAETKKLCKKKNMRSVFDTEIRGWFFLKTLSDPWKLRIVAYYSSQTIPARHTDLLMFCQ